MIALLHMPVILQIYQMQEITKCWTHVEPRQQRPLWVEFEPRNQSLYLPAAGTCFSTCSAPSPHISEELKPKFNEE